MEENIDTIYRIALSHTKTPADASDDLEVENVVIEITDTNVDEYEIELNGK